MKAKDEADRAMNQAQIIEERANREMESLMKETQDREKEAFEKWTCSQQATKKLKKTLDDRDKLLRQRDADLAAAQAGMYVKW